jgi:hypothetical protein
MGAALAVDPNNSSIIYTGGYTATSSYPMIVSKTTNGGTTWKRDTLITGAPICYAIAIDRSNTNVVYAGGDSSYLFKTTNGGVNWVLSNSGIRGTVYDIKISQTNSNTLYAGTSSGVFKSTNAGVNWTNTGLSAEVNAVLINPSNEAEIYAATTTGIYKSTNSGSSWTLMNAGLMITNTTSLGIFPNNWLFCGTYGSGMYRWNLQVGVEESNAEKEIKDVSFELLPNPFRKSLIIKYTIQDTGEMIQDTRYKIQDIRLKIYDVTGRIVKQFNYLTSYQSPVIWFGDDDSGRRLSSGVYFVRLEDGDFKKTEKVILLR